MAAFSLAWRTVLAGGILLLLGRRAPRGASPSDGASRPARSTKPLRSGRRIELPSPTARLATAGDPSSSGDEVQRARLDAHRAWTYFERLFHQNPAPTVFARLASGQIIDANDSAARMLGYRRDEIIGSSIRELGIWGSDPQVELLTRRLQGRDLVTDLEFRVRTKSGDERDVLATLQRIDVDDTPCALTSMLDVTERLRAEVALRTANDQLRQLSRRILEVQEGERTRIARELHDEVGQLLAAIKLELEAIRCRASSPELDTQVQGTIGLLGRAGVAIRTLAYDLRPSVLDDLGLAAGLRALTTRMAASAGLSLDLQIDGLEHTIGNHEQTACFRIAQEAITNAIRHGQARHLRVLLRDGSDDVELLVQDDGSGFDVAAVQSRDAKDALGLIGMRERAASVGGELLLLSEAGRGTTVRLRIPRMPA